MILFNWRIVYIETIIDILDSVLTTEHLGCYIVL